MDIDLLGLQPHKVSRDLRGYSVFFYGEPKSGKTTIASKFPDALLLAFEKGYNALAGVMAQPINSWAEFIKVNRQLKDDKVKEKFATIIIDTSDIAYEYCEKYICNNNGVDTIGDIPYGKGYELVEKEFDSKLRSIVQMGYGIVLISHATDKVFTNESGEQYNKIVSTLDKRGNRIVTRMADIIGYAHTTGDINTGRRVLTLRSNDNSVRCGCRFKYMATEIPFTYEALEKALNEAIDKEAEETSGAYITNERQAAIDEPHFDHHALMEEFNSLVQDLMLENQSNAAKIVVIVDKYLGKGKKVSDTTPAQAELVALIVDEIKSDLIKK